MRSASFERFAGACAIAAGGGGLASAVLLLVIHVGRLTILDPKNPALLTAALRQGSSGPDAGNVARPDAT